VTPRAPPCFSCRTGRRVPGGQPAVARRLEGHRSRAAHM
jgi:hypothetical protein